MEGSQGSSLITEGEYILEGTRGTKNSKLPKSLQTKTNQSNVTNSQLGDMSGHWTKYRRNLVNAQQSNQGSSHSGGKNVFSSNSRKDKLLQQNVYQQQL